jgi:Transglutaminase-like superfamily
MRMLVIHAYRELLRFEFYLARGDFEALYRKVRTCPIRRAAYRVDSLRDVCHAIDLASIWYWKRILCLQRSAATACLLRKSGIAAELVIGVRKVPFRAHAWVEADGDVLNEKPYMSEKYTVLDRC